VFDIDLGVDTKVFIDPLLLAASTVPEFSEIRNKNLEYFSRLIRMVKASIHSEQMKKKALDMLAVKEPQGLSIGYGNKSDKGTAIPINVASSVIMTLMEIVRIGIEDPEIVEVLSMFVHGYVLVTSLCTFYMMTFVVLRREFRKN
jgi:hypothetical protein